MQPVNPNSLKSLAAAATLALMSVCVCSSPAMADCTKTVECAQAAVNAATRAQADVKALQSKLSNMKPVTSEGLPCTAYHDWAAAHPGDDPWSHVIVRATCPSGTTMISGGCSLTCAGEFAHTVSAPSQDGHSWECGVISNDTTRTRTYNAVALCLRLE